MALAASGVAGAALAPDGHDGSGSGQPAAVQHAAGQRGAGQSAAAGSGSIDQLRARLRRLPGDWLSWAQLGLGYLEQARLTADPGHYAGAEQAFQRSLSIRPAARNAPALAGLGALAAARHDFTGALHYGQSAVAADPYQATARGVVADALVELGRYDQAWDAIQRMADLRPDTGSYARASYAYELRGDVAMAGTLMRRALEVAPGPEQAAFARYHLAMLALDSGDPSGAADQVTAGLRVAPEEPSLRAARARVAAARGNTAAAVADLRTVVDRLPLPGYAAELGDLLESAGDKSGAEQQYALVGTAAALQATQGVDVDTELALFHADHGMAATALREAQAAYRKRPSITVADALAWALHTNHRDAEALRHANEALRLGTRNALAFYHRGAIRAALGQRAAARADLTEALRINPHFSVRHAPIARATLARLSAGARPGDGVR